MNWYDESDMETHAGLIYLTSEVEGIGGTIKNRPEDFIVEEVPKYEPTGSGDYLWVFMEKDMRLTTDVVRLFSKHFEVPWSSVGYAGMKDKRAVTLQHYTVEGGTIEKLESFNEEHIRVIDADYTEKPLKRGHLIGNKFDIRIRDVNPNEILRVKRIMDRLRDEGMPNYIGPQRFGFRGDNHLQGRLLLLNDLQGYLDLFLGGPREDEPERNSEARRYYEEGDYARALDAWITVHRFERQALGPLSRGAPIEDVVNAIDLPHRNLLVSAFQSAIFNELLQERMMVGTFNHVQVGDVVANSKTKSMEVVREDNLEAYEQLCSEQVVSPTGPMWGPGMMEAEGDTAEREAEALQKTGVTMQHFEDSEYDTRSSRRPYRIEVENARYSAGSDEHGPFVRLQFQLQRGCFATTVLREIMKNEE